MRRLARMRELEVWIAWVRLGGVLFAFLEVGIFAPGYPGNYEAYASATTGVFAVGGMALWQLTRRAYRPVVGLVALVFDLCVIAAYSTVYPYEYGAPTRWALILVVIEGALRYGLRGGVSLSVVLLPFLVFLEWWRAHEFGGPHFITDRVTFPFGIFVLSGIIVGWLARRPGGEAELADARAPRGRELRDQLGRRVDVLEAANRCARALGSSLEVDRAFSAFIRELGGLISFDRVTIVLVDGDRAEVMATAGRGADSVFPPRSTRPFAGSAMEEGCWRAAWSTGSPCGRPRTRRKRRFSDDEVELATLLGRLVASAVQNIRAYEAERKTVEELRRLWALRADRVSLVSHELRSPMAAVIGPGRTLQGRWRQLSAEQRQSFLAVIADETTRLSNLIADVLDTSRIEAGTFSYAFSDVDVALVREVVSAAAVGQDEVRVLADVNGILPSVRGDASASDRFCRTSSTTRSSSPRSTAPCTSQRAPMTDGCASRSPTRGGRAARGPALDLREVRPLDPRRREAGQRARPVHRPFDRRGARRLDRRQREVEAWSDLHAALAARIGLRSGRVDARRRARSGAPLPVRRCVRADRLARARPLRPGRRGSLRRAIRGSRPASRRAQSHP